MCEAPPHICWDKRGDVHSVDSTLGKRVGEKGWQQETEWSLSWTRYPYLRNQWEPVKHAKHLRNNLLLLPMLSVAQVQEPS